MGSEVPQVYLGPPTRPPSSVQFTPQKLVAFKRLELGPRGRERVTLHVSRLELSYWSTQERDWILLTGERDGSEVFSHAKITL